MIRDKESTEFEIANLGARTRELRDRMRPFFYRYFLTVVVASNGLKTIVGYDTSDLRTCSLLNRALEVGACHGTLGEDGLTQVRDSGDD